MKNKRTKIIPVLILAVFVAAASLVLIKDNIVAFGKIPAAASKVDNKSVANNQNSEKPVITSDKKSGSTAGEQSKTSTQDLQNMSLKDIIKTKGITNASEYIKIFIDKSDHKLSIYYKNVLLKSYNVDIGEGGLGAKQVYGDYKTPEGTFYVTEKTTMDPADYYLGTRWMRLSYPAKADAERGLSQGLIDQDTHDAIVDAINNGTTPPQETGLGGSIGIHGGTIPSFGKDWTWGCIGLANKDVEDFYGFIRVGTPVIIQQ